MTLGLISWSLVGNFPNLPHTKLRGFGMKRALSVSMAAFIAVVVGGCGTVCNLAGGVLHPDEEPRVYGGVQRDLEGKWGFGYPPLDSESTVEDVKDRLYFLALLPVEFGLSFVGDTLTLPITIPLQARREAANKSGDSSAVCPAPLGPSESLCGK